MTDLANNRAGRITSRQRLKLLRGEATLLAMTGVGLAITIGLGANIVNVFSALGLFGGFVVMLVLLACVVGTLVGGFRAVMVLIDLALGRVRSVTGLPTLRRETVRATSLAPVPSAFADPRQYRHKVIVGDMEFDIDYGLAHQLARDSRSVRVYFAAQSGELLSLEPVEAALEAS